MSGPTTEISTLAKLPVRDIWKHEAHDFTTWLAKEENLATLTQELDIDLYNTQTEAAVGRFNVDILAEDEQGNSVIIENQLEASDHDHLGKLITYAAGLDAKTAIWIVDEPREEHTSAISWLNDNTSEEANFFLIQLEVWKIDNSRPAPRFNVISKPNGWTKAARQSKGASKELSENKLQQLEFFTGLREFGEGNTKYIKSWRKPRPRHWYTFAIGTAGIHMSAIVNSTKDLVATELYIREDDELFEQLLSKKSSIETDLGFEMDWRALPDKKASRIIIEKSGDFQNPDEHPELFEWLVHKLEAIARVFPQHLDR